MGQRNVITMSSANLATLRGLWDAWFWLVFFFFSSGECEKAVIGGGRCA